MSLNCPPLVRPRRRGTGAAFPTGRRSCPASTSAWRSPEGIATLWPRSRSTKAALTVVLKSACSSFAGLPAALFLAEELEARLARGEAVDIAEHALLSSTLVRLAQRIGINRVAKDLTPSLGDYLRSSPPPDFDSESAE